jgi:transcriptional regulator with XRE-family HTH domain
MDLSIALRLATERAGKSYLQIAREAGVNPKTVSNIVRGTRTRTTVKILGKLKSTLPELNDLLARDESPFDLPEERRTVVGRDLYPGDITWPTWIERVANANGEHEPGKTLSVTDLTDDELRLLETALDRFVSGVVRDAEYLDRLLKSVA